MKCPWLPGLVVVALLSVTQGLAQGLCSVCNRYLDDGERSGIAVDQMTLKERVVCERCASIPERCTLCLMPAKDGRKSLTDGRHYCARDAQVAVFGSLEVERICRETVARMERPFGRYLTLPETGVVWKVEDLLLQAGGNAAGPRRCAHPVLRYSVSRGEQNASQYTIFILNGLPPERIRSATVHGIMHAWLTTQVAPGRRMRPETVESFCDLIAWLAMREFGESAEADRVRGMHESNSQFAELVKAYEIYDLYRVLEWMRFGADDQLVAGDDDRMRRLDPSLQPKPTTPRQVIPPAAVRTPAPEELVLRGILGRGARRLALVNDATLGAGEEVRAHLGTRAIRLKCLEIRDDAVVVQVDGGERQELRLASKEDIP